MVIWLFVNKKQIDSGSLESYLKFENTLRKIQIAHVLNKIFKNFFVFKIL